MPIAILMPLERILSLGLQIDENQSTKDNSDSGSCETLETPNIFLFPSVLSFITILIWSCFILERFILGVSISF